jgi:hypothetical protein
MSVRALVHSRYFGSYARRALWLFMRAVDWISNSVGPRCSDGGAPGGKTAEMAKGSA